MFRVYAALNTILCYTGSHHNGTRPYTILVSNYVNPVCCVATVATRFAVCTMMTSSNGNIFRVTGSLCGEFTGPGEFPTQRPVTRSFDVFFDLRLNKRLSKQPWGWWFETPSWSLWRQCNDWGHLGHFRRNISLSKRHKIVCMRYFSCTFNQMKSINMFSMFLQAAVPKNFLWRSIAVWT